MQKSYQRLLDGNRNWVETTLAKDPDFFKNSNKGQSPEFLWIGCSDSRVPANEITGTRSGDIFVHRNIANVVVHTDFNLMSVLEYAVEVLKVKHIIVCGHYNCGGVNAALSNGDFGLVNNWLRNIKEVYSKYADVLDGIEDPKQKSNKLVEFNVIEQVKNLAKTAIIQRAWKNQSIQIHGWVYGLDSGLIKDLMVMVQQNDELDPIFRYD